MSENISRHLTVSQSAISEALLFPKGKKGNRYTDSRTRAGTGSRKIGESTMRLARQLVDPENNAADLIEQVKSDVLGIGLLP